MAYTINGKVYTDHPLMDEMIFNINKILKTIEIKNEDLALKYETEKSLGDGDTYINIINDELSFDTFPFTEDLLMKYGYSEKDAKDIIADRYIVPFDLRETLAKDISKLFIDQYEETNNYYRALIGLPWLDEYNDSTDYYVYINESYITEPSLVNIFDFSLPLHEYTNYQITVLVSLGVMDIIYSEYPGKYYKYLHFLGDSRQDLYTVRSAAKWDIIYMPSVEILVSDRFKQLYQINRTLFLQRFYSDAYKISSDYYDEFMIIILLCQTYTDMIADIPEWYVRRDIFDLRSCQYFLESHGIEFFKIIPLKYQVRIVKNMNKLIKYKSTNKNIWDIIDIFSIDTINVYKYYLFKKRLANEQGSYITGKDLSEEYELEFVKAPIGDTYDNTIKDNIYREPYDDITYQDKYWDGQNTHDTVKEWHMAKDFTIEGTKYLSLENKISLEDYASQTEYFMGLLLDSNLDLSDICINIPTISDIVSFSISDLFILLFCLTGSYDDYNVLIRTPINMRTKEKPEFEKYDDYDGGNVSTESSNDFFGGTPYTKNKFRKNMNGGDSPEYTEITQETFYDWLGWKYPYIWTDMSERVYGFNTNADLEELKELIGFRHSAFIFERGYTLEELGVDSFLTTKDIDTIDELINVYETNMEIKKSLTDKILNAESRDQKVVLQFVYDYLFTRNFDYDRYMLQSTGELAYSYDEILKEKNYILWKYYSEITKELEKETRQDMIRQAMNDIINTLEYYLNYDSLKYIFSTFTVTSFTSVLKYIYLMVNFFKSFKVYFLDSYTSFVTDNKIENRVEMIDGIEEEKINYWKKDKERIRDASQITVEFEKEDLVGNNLTEVLELYGYQEPDPTFDPDIKGGKISDGWNFTDLDGGPVEEQVYVLNIDGSYPTPDYYEKHQPFAYFYNIFGGGPNTEIPVDDHTHDPGTDLDNGPIRDVDGGGVPLISYSPFHMLNGGNVAAGKAVFDLDGSGPLERQNYLDINGTIPGTTKELHVPSKSFGYNVDGGHPGTKEFVSKSMIVRVVDNQVEAEVRLAPTYNDIENMIEYKDDGLYLGNPAFGMEDFLEITEDMNETLESYNIFYNESLDRITLASNKDSINQRVDEITLRYFGDAIEAYNNFEANLAAVEESIISYTNRRVEELEELASQWDSSTSILGWGYF